MTPHSEEAKRKRQRTKPKAPPKKRKQPKGGYPPVPSKSVR